MGHPGNELVLGSLDLVGRMPQGDNFRLIVTGDDATWGNPQSVTSTLKGLLRDGAQVSLDSWENREAFLRVVILSETGDGLADGEAALFSELGKRNTLAWTPPGGFAAPCVFDVVWSELDHEFKPVEESLGRVEYGVRLTCLPFTRPVDPVLSEVFQAPAPSASPTVVTVDDGSSATSWSASQHAGVSSSVSSVSGAVRARWSAPLREAKPFHLARNAPVSMTGTRFLRVEWASFARPDHEWSGRALTVNGRHYTASMVAFQERLADGRFVSWLDVGTGTVTQIGVVGVLTRTGMTPAPGPILVPPGELVVYDIRRSDQIATTSGTGHQVSLAVPVAGSAPTQGSIHIWDSADTDLGDVLLYTGPRDGMVSLEPFVSSATTPLGGTVSGTSKSLNGAPVLYDIPSTVFNPNRSTGYLLMARLSTVGSGSLTTVVQSIVGTWGADPVFVGPQQTQDVPATSGLDLACLGAFTVPPLRVDGPDAGLRVSLWLNSPTGTPFIDDLWLVDIESGSLTWVDKEDSAFWHMWVEPASVEVPLPRVRLGAGFNGAVGWEASPKSYGVHQFPPGEVHVTAVATEAEVSKMQIEYFPRFHTYVRSAS